MLWQVWLQADPFKYRVEKRKRLRSNHRGQQAVHLTSGQDEQLLPVSVKLEVTPSLLTGNPSLFLVQL